MKTIRHRRADEERWLEANPIIPDGEIALVKRGGVYDLAIGDGVSSFSELGCLGGRILTDYEAWYYECELKRGDDIRLGMVEELYITLPDPMPEDFYATISFDCDEFGTAIYLPADPICHFTGASTEYGEFYPEMFNHYTLVFWYDGALECAVRGRYYG